MHRQLYTDFDISRSDLRPSQELQNTRLLLRVLMTGFMFLHRRPPAPINLQNRLAIRYRYSDSGQQRTLFSWSCRVPSLNRLEYTQFKTPSVNASLAAGHSPGGKTSPCSAAQPSNAACGACKLPWYKADPYRSAQFCGPL
jgi:hypothetical protein